MNKMLQIKSMNLSQKCSICDCLAVKIEIIEPNGYPFDVTEWSMEDLSDYDEFRDFNSIYLKYSGPGGSNGIIGDPIDEEDKLMIINTFTSPFNSEDIRARFYDMAGLCGECMKFYCSKHWNISLHGFGKCPNGHDQSLDPHWSPSFE